MGVGVAADVDEQGRVVDDRPLLLVQADTLRQAQGNDALAENVLHRLPEAQIDSQRHGGDQLGQTHSSISAPGSHRRDAIRQGWWLSC